MAESQIIKDLVEGDASLEQSLSRLLLVVSDLDNKELSSWVRKELHGYNMDDELPAYRIYKGLSLKYSGINNCVSVTNAVLPLGFLSVNTLNYLSEVPFKEGVVSLEKVISTSESISIDRGFYIDKVAKNTNNAVICTALKQQIPDTFLFDLLASVKSRVLDAMLELEKEYGNLDKLGLNVSKVSKTKLALNNARLNNAVLNISYPSEPSKEPWYSKIAWKVVIPILTAVAGTAAGAAVTVAVQRLFQ